MGALVIVVLFELFMFFAYVAASIMIHSKKTLLKGEDDIYTEFENKKTEQLKKSGVKMSFGVYIAIAIIAPVITGTTVYLLLKNISAAVSIGILSACAPEVIIFLLKRKKNADFEERYARSLEQLSSSLRAGLNVHQAIDDVANCKFIHEDMRRHYARLSAELSMGGKLTDAFRHFAEDLDSPDARDVALVLDIQTAIGGHEADVIKKIADNIHRRLLFRREIASEFASLTVIVWVLDFIAPIIIVYFCLSTPEYVDIYTSSPLYMMLFGIVVVILLIGSLICHGMLRRAKGAI